MSDLKERLKSIKLGQARSVLFGLWLAGAGLLVLLHVVYALTEIFGESAESTGKAWAWLLPTFGPPVSLLLASFLSQGGKGEEDDDERMARPVLFYLAFGMSVIYLVAVAGVMIFAANQGQDWSLHQQNATAPLSFLQSLLIALLGVFFVARSDKKGNDGDKPAET